MTNGFKEIPSEKRKLDLLVTAGLGFLAAVVYFMTLTKGVFPGESARLMAVFGGLEPLDLPRQPIWGLIVSWLSTLDVFSLPVRLNLFSAVCSAFSVALMYRLMSFLVHDTIYEEYSVEYAPRVSVWSGVFAALAFLFAVPVWHAATRMQYQSFDLMLALVAANLLVSYAIRPRLVWLVAFALLIGSGIVESVIFIPLAPVFVAFLVFVLWKSGSLSLYRVTWMGALAVAGMCLYYVFAWKFFRSTDCEAQGVKSVMDVLVLVWKSQLFQLRSGLPRVGWLVLLLMSVVPWVAGGLASFRALNNERSWSQYILHFVLTIIVVLGLTNVAISPWEILKIGRAHV